MPEDSISKSVLQQEIGQLILEAMQGKDIASKQAATALHEQFGLSLTSMSMYVSNVINGRLNGSSFANTRSRNPELVLRRLAALVRWLGIEPNSPTVDRIKEWDEQFDYNAEMGHVPKQPRSNSETNPLEKIVMEPHTQLPGQSQRAYIHSSLQSPPYAQTRQPAKTATGGALHEESKPAEITELPVMATAKAPSTAALIQASQNGIKAYSIDGKTGDVPTEVFQTGDRIKHSKWGTGTVVLGLAEADEAEIQRARRVRMQPQLPSTYVFHVKFDNPPKEYMGELAGPNTLRLGARRRSFG